MHSMKHQDTLVIGGVDSHADTHHAAAMDQRGALLATKGFPTTTPGYRALLDWLCAFGEVDVVAVESTGSYAAALVRYLREHDVRILEVNQPHAHTRRRRGKNDPIDAEMATRLALSGKATTVPKQTDGNEVFLPVLIAGFVFSLCNGIAILRGSLLPRLLGWVAIVIAIVFLVPPAGFASLLALILWSAVVSILMFLRFDRGEAHPAPAVEAA